MEERTYYDLDEIEIMNKASVPKVLINTLLL